MAELGGALTIKIEAPEISTVSEWVLVPDFSLDELQSRREPSPYGIGDEYQFTFVLSIPGKEVFHSSLDFATLMRSGATLLYTNPSKLPVITLFNGNESVSIKILVSQDGMITSALMSLIAPTVREATRIGYTLMLQALTLLCFEHDVAIDISGYEVIETATGAKWYSFGVLGRTRVLNLAMAGMSAIEFRPILSTYREAMNATNPLYQALCFYKVIEGVNKIRRERVQVTLAKGKKPREQAERIPSSMADFAFAPFLGWKFSRVINHHRGTVRNALAHLDPDIGVIDADNYDDIIKCRLAIPVLKYIARTMLENELQRIKKNDNESL